LALNSLIVNINRALSGFIHPLIANLRCAKGTRETAVLNWTGHQ